MIDIKDIEEARERRSGCIRRTGLEHSSAFEKLSGVDVYLKPECLQKTGSFKFRGASNKILSLSEEEKKRGVVTASSGNHGQGVACAAAMVGCRATVIMPENGSPAKAASIKGYGAELLFCGTTSEERLKMARSLSAEGGAVMVHPYDDPKVMAGQGTIGLEILEDLNDVAAVLVPTGGCGLISGIATAVKSKRPEVKVIGVEPEKSNSTGISFRAGRRTPLSDIDTIADGVRTTIPGEITFPVVLKYVDEMVQVSDQAIRHATRMILERCKILAEPTGALAAAAILDGVLPPGLKGKKVVALVSGGNISLNALAGIIKTAE